MYQPIYVKSSYSLLSSMLKIDDIISYSLNNNQTSCFLTDSNMFGAMEFFNKCKKNNIKPILGLELNIDEDILLVYAKNYNGYQSLIKLSTIQSEKKVTLEDIKNNKNDLVAVISKYNDNFYNNIKIIIEDLFIGYRNKEEEKELLKITDNLVFCSESLYLKKEDSTYLTYLYKIRDSKTISDDNYLDVENKELVRLNILDLTTSRGLSNIEKIISKCNVTFKEAQLLLPIFEIKNNISPSTYLFELAKVGLNKRLEGNVPSNYKERLIYELKVIEEMGFCNYFLVVYDFIKYAKQNKILVGPGRGSAAGSLVSFSLGITDIDPIKYDLLFERFLNPKRLTMPDIDTDFPDKRRDEVINYVTNKYGKKRVAGIVTFGTLGAKQALRDVARILNIPSYKVDSLSKFIPAFTKEKLDDYYKSNKGFRAKIDSDFQLKKLFSIAKRIEGYPRHTSSHAAGIVMCQKDLDEVIPLTVSDGMYLSAYSMEYLEDLGLLKMDFLGLKNLTIITNVLEDIKKIKGVEIDFNKIPLDDIEALKTFEFANTSGIFQFESTGMRNFLRRLKPNSLEDIFAAIALFRPGPAGNIDTYINRKHKKEKVVYLDSSLEQVLKNTYGIIIYQEQIMQVASIFANYSLGDADILRRAMSKKKYDLLKAEEEKFISKSLENNKTYEKAKEIFELILSFASFGFNRSHSVAYSLIAYKMAYLKAHYKDIFFANLLTNVIGSETKTKEYIVEARGNGIITSKPNINLSEERYVVKKNTIIYPFSNIKQVGTVATKAILEARKQESFTDIYDAFSRLYIAGVTKNTLECLILADTFKCFGYNSATLIYNLDSLFNYAELTKDLDESLVMKPEIEIKKGYPLEMELEQELEVFGFYLSHHPTTIYESDNPGCIKLENIPEYFSKKIDVVILIDKVKVINTKKGDKMSFITGSDETASLDFTLFPRVYNDYSNLVRGQVIRVKGTVEKRLNEYQIIVDRVNVLTKGEKDEER